MLDARPVHAKEAVETRENFGDLVFKSRIKKAIKSPRRPVRGSSVIKYEPDGRQPLLPDLAKRCSPMGVSARACAKARWRRVRATDESIEEGDIEVTATGAGGDVIVAGARAAGGRGRAASCS